MTTRITSRQPERLTAIPTHCPAVSFRPVRKLPSRIATGISASSMEALIALVSFSLWNINNPTIHIPSIPCPMTPTASRRVSANTFFFRVAHAIANMISPAAANRQNEISPAETPARLIISLPST